MSGGIGISGINNLGKELVIPPLDTGWLSFAGVGSFAQIPGAGTDWVDVENMLIEDVARAAAFVQFGSSPILADEITAQELAGNPIPVGATIVGIEVRYMRLSGGAAGTEDSVIQLIKGGVAQGDNKSIGTAWISGTVDREDIFGGPFDMWGLVLTPADVNAVGFGVSTIANGTVDFGTASINVIQMKIHYTE